MVQKKIWLIVFTVVLAAMIALTAAIGSVPQDKNETSEELALIDPTDMSQYYAMGEYYPPDSVDTLNIDWQGGRVEVSAYNGNDYFVEEAATRYLQENERLSYTLDGASFTVHYLQDTNTVLNDAYKKVEIRIPRGIAQNLKALNITTNGEVVLKNLTVGSITVNGQNGSVRVENSYSSPTKITTRDGNVALFVDNNTGYSVDFSSRKGVLDSYVDNGMNSYVSGDGKYPFFVKTKTGNLDVAISTQ